MTIPEILKDLETYTGRFPLAAMRGAVARREEMIPELLRVLESVAADPIAAAAREDYMPHIFAVFLLAEFRVKSAYPLVVQIVKAPGETPFDLFGDTITESLGSILASICHGELQPLQFLIESEDVNDFVRSGALEALLVLENTELIPRKDLIHYLRELFRGRLRRQPSHAWNALASAVADLSAAELMPELRQAYEDGLVDSGFVSIKNVERDIRAPDPRNRERHQLIESAIDEMSWWDSFRADDLPSNQAMQPPKPWEFASPSPRERLVTNPSPAPKIGRNEPCPCGSGQKYKKCCGK